MDTEWSGLVKHLLGVVVRTQVQGLLKDETIEHALVSQEWGHISTLAYQFDSLARAWLSSEAINHHLFLMKPSTRFSF